MFCYVLEILHHSNSFHTVFNDVDSDYKRLHRFGEYGTYIKPIEIVVGEQLSDVKKEGMQSLQPSTCTFSLGGVLTETLNFINSMSDNGQVKLH